MVLSFFNLNEGSILKLPPGTPRTPRFLEEGGRIPGPPGKSVRGGAQPSRVRPGGKTALDCCAPPLTTRYKLRIESLHVSPTSTSLKQQPPSNNNQFSATTNITNSKNSTVSPVG